MQFQDIYDIHNLVSAGIDNNAVRRILPEKFKARGLSLLKLYENKLEPRRIEFEKDWERRLNYLVLNRDLQFEEVWHSVLSFLDELWDNL